MSKEKLVDLKTNLLSHGLNRDELVEDFLTRNSLSFNELHPHLKEFEIEQVEKVGPYSIQLSVNDRIPDISLYFSKNKQFSPDENAFVNSVDHVIKEFNLNGRLRPLSLDVAYERSDKTTNWGAPNYTSGKHSGLDHLSLAKQIVSDGHVPNFDSALGWRGQPSGGPIPKQRVVWVYAHSIVLIEVAFQTVLLEHLRKFDEFSMWRSIDDVSIPITDMLRSSEKLDWPLLGFDATAFDTSIHRKFIYAAFYIIKSAFQKSYWKQLDLLCQYFCYSGMLSGNGRRFHGRDGSVPSGSGLTNLVDCIVQLLAFNYVRFKTTGANVGKCVVQGDDGVWFLPFVELETITDHCYDLGLTMNPSKQYFRMGSVTFCQRLFVLDMADQFGIVRGVRSVIRTLNSMMSYERRVPDDAPLTYESCRFLTQLEESRYNPMFKDLVSYIIPLDPYNLGINLNTGPIELFRMTGFTEFMKYSGKGFLYTSLVREEKDLSKLNVINLINEWAGYR
jgi:hypothetical protein